MASILVFLLLGTLLLPMINVAGNTSVSTSVSVDSDHHGNVSNGGFVYTSANPALSLSVDNPNNASVISTVYRLTSSASNQTFTYNGTFTIYQNHSNNYTLHYRTNSTSGLENWKMLSISVDADSPELSISSNNQLPARYVHNSSSYVISASNPIKIECSDNLSGVQFIQYSLGNLSAQVSSSSVNITSSILNQSTTNGHGRLNVSCVDMVGNAQNMTFSLVLDDEIPILSVVESGTRTGFVLEILGNSVPRPAIITPHQVFNNFNNRPGSPLLNQSARSLPGIRQSHSGHWILLDILALHNSGPFISTHLLLKFNPQSTARASW